MERFIKGDVVIVPFPFSDLSNSKKRPAFVIADLKGNDIILCQIKSQLVRDSYAITLKESDFEKGSLEKNSNVRPNRLFTADKSIIARKAGTVHKNKVKEIIDKLLNIIA